MRETGYANVRDMFRQADDIDKAEGKLAYRRYRQMMQTIAENYGHDIREITAAFVALSPNNDYVGNLRSLKTMLEGERLGVPLQDISISTYNACKLRAHAYLTKRDDFLLTARGPKTRAFYHNILWPDNPDHVTIDGHIAAIFYNNEGTMKENIIKSDGNYNKIAAAVKRCARINMMLPNQMQAILWFTRKRLLRVKFDAQFQLFGDPSDRWQSIIPLEQIQIFPFKTRPGGKQNYDRVDPEAAVRGAAAEAA